MSDYFEAKYTFQEKWKIIEPLEFMTKTWEDPKSKDTISVNFRGENKPYYSLRDSEQNTKLETSSDIELDDFLYNNY